MSKDNASGTERIAVALTWDGGREAPRVSAKGDELLAQEILNIAKEYGVPLHEDAQLARLLSQLELDEEIPPALYLAVAKVIAFAYYLSGRTSVFDTQEA